MNTEQKKAFKKWQTRTLFGTILGYALFYFVRKNFSLAMPGMEADLGISKTELGTFLTLYGVIYGSSQLINGMFADRKNARWYMSIALFLAVCANVAFGFGEDIAMMITGSTDAGIYVNALIIIMGCLWLFNGMFQGAGFPPCARLLTHWFEPKILATKMSTWNISHSIGAGMVVILSGYIMAHFGTDVSANPEAVSNIAANLNIDMATAKASEVEHVMRFAKHSGAWKLCFFIPAAISLLGVFALIWILRDTPKSVGLPELGSENGETKIKTDTKSAAYRAFISKFVFRNPLMWILGFGNFFVYIVRFAILDWGPMLLSQSKHVSLSHAGWLVAMFEVAGIIGMLFAGYATDKWLKGRAHRTSMFCMLGTAGFMAIFWILPVGAPIWMFYFTLGAAGFCIYGPQALIGISAAQHATKKAAGTANGFKGLFGYASTLVSGVGLGFIADHYGWNAVYIGVIIVALIGMGVLMLIWKAKADSYEEVAAYEAALEEKEKQANQPKIALSRI
ncbi:MFS transporter [Maribellus sp. YY47]|uniref:MFS transporter n=1 Tax=Maribellus sp. YY47 TaxID=2929486 RepID=UPI0020009E3F|nr:MFS transporter [Maribellus sp. YY47]MCK3686297.1 MFS transporter [Maribellus sp. YY47]